MDYILITGATGGIGYELAKLFGNNGFGLVLNSSNYDRLLSTQKKLQKMYSVPVYIFEQDLTKLGAAQELYDKVKQEQLPISILVNNAGFGLVGATDEIEISQDESMLIINIMNLVELSKLCFAEMIGYGKGKILNVSSTGAFQPGPYTSTYFASKAFVLSYTRAIRYEAKRKGVQVSALCPGATKTNFFEREGTKTPTSAMSAEKVAKIAFRGLMKDKEVIIPGLKNRFMQLFPIKVKMIAVAKMKE